MATTRRVYVPFLVFAFSVVAISSAYAQAKPAAPASTAPAAPAKWVPAVKGIATIEFMQSASKKNPKTNELETVLKIKNTSKGSIALLGVEEFWYNQKREIVSGDSHKIKRLLNPGEVVEVTMSSPWKDGLYISQYVFTHANGKVEPKKVKKLE
jgi:hypothetical protein